MLEIVKTLDEKRVTARGKRMTQVVAVCGRCGSNQVMLLQNVMKHNRLGREHCASCIEDSFHRMTNSRIYRIWRGMTNRARGVCDSENYFDCGIDVCKRWESFRNFYEDMSAGYSDELTLERIDNDKGYCRENCRWATNLEQQSNKRNNRRVVYQGEEMHLAELVRRSGVSKTMLRMRLNRGMSADEAVEDARRSPYGKSQDPKNVVRRERRRSTT